MSLGTLLNTFTQVPKEAAGSAVLACLRRAHCIPLEPTCTRLLKTCASSVLWLGDEEYDLACVQRRRTRLAVLGRLNALSGWRTVFPDVARQLGEQPYCVLGIATVQSRNAIVSKRNADENVWQPVVGW